MFGYKTDLYTHIYTKPVDKIAKAKGIGHLSSIGFSLRREKERSWGKKSQAKIFHLFQRNRSFFVVVKILHRLKSYLVWLSLFQVPEEITVSPPTIKTREPVIDKKKKYKT